MIINSIEKNHEIFEEKKMDAVDELFRVPSSNPGYDLELVKHIAYPADTVDEIDVSLDDLINGVFLRLHGGRPANLVLTDREGWSFDDFALDVSNPGSNIAYRLDTEAAAEAEPSPSRDGLSFVATYIHEFQTPVTIKRVILESVNRALVSFFDAGGQTGYTAGLSELGGYGTQNLYIYKGGGNFDATRIVADVYSTYVLNRAPRMSVIIPNKPQNIRISDGSDKVLHAAPHLLGDGDAMTTPDLAASLNDAETPDFAFRITSQYEAVVFVQAQATRHREATGWAHVDPAGQPDKIALTPWNRVQITPTLPSGAGSLSHIVSGKVDFDGPVRAQLFDLIDTSSTQTRVTLSPRMKYAQPFRLTSTAAEVAQSIAGFWLMLHSVPAAESSLHLAVRSHDIDMDQPGDALAEAEVTLPDVLDGYQRTQSGHLALWVALPDPLLVDGPDLATFIALELSAQDGPAALAEVALTDQTQILPGLSLDLSRDARWRHRNAFASPKTLLFEPGLTADPGTPSTVTLQSGSGPAAPHATDDAGQLQADIPSAGSTLSLTSLRAARIDDLKVTTRD